MLRVRDLMSQRLLTLRDNSSVGRAESEMKLARIRHLPILDAEGALVGMISNRDVLRCLGNEVYGRSLCVSRIMSRPVVTVAIDAPAQEAAHLLREHKFGALPVVDSERRLAGIITETDLLAVAERALSGEPLGRARAHWEYMWHKETGASEHGGL
jgi:CBS domain-containing protein